MSRSKKTTQMNPVFVHNCLYLSIFVQIHGARWTNLWTLRNGLIRSYHLVGLDEFVELGFCQIAEA